MTIQKGSVRVGYIFLGIVICFLMVGLDLTNARKSAHRDKALFSSAAVFVILIMALGVLALGIH
jgi:hypothetical protein